MPQVPSTLDSSERARDRAVVIVALVAGGILLAFDATAEGDFRIPAWALIGASLAWLGGWRLGIVIAVAAVLEATLTGPKAGGASDMAREAISLAIVLVIIAVAVANWRKTREVAVRLAVTDELTGLLNRRGFRGAVENEISRAGRTGRGFAVAFLDCDRFKAINDSLGHHAGDEALRRIAKTLREQTRGYDAVARLGGDEFGVLLPETSLESAVEVVRRLQQGIAEDSPDGRYRMSAGLVWTAGGETYDDLLAHADRELLAAKQAGGSGLSWRREAPREESVSTSIEG